MNTSQRSAFIDYCPEIKILYPVLHSSECFGQSPQPLACFQFLCSSGGLRCESVGQRQWIHTSRSGQAFRIDLNLSSSHL
jgi:hypothetical protein